MSFWFPNADTVDGVFIHDERGLREYLVKKGIDYDELEDYYKEKFSYDSSCENSGDDYELIADGYHTELVSIYNLLEELADELETGTKRKKTYAEQLRVILRNEFSIQIGE